MSPIMGWLPRLGGLGKLVSAAEVVPIVLPIYHLNMEEILPPGSSLPAIGKKVKGGSSHLSPCPAPVSFLFFDAECLRCRLSSLWVSPWTFPACSASTSWRSPASFVLFFVFDLPPHIPSL